MMGGLQTSTLFDDYRKNGERLQLMIDRLAEGGVPIKYGDEFNSELSAARMTFQNLQHATQAAMTVKAYVEQKLGMNVDGIVAAMGGNKDLVRAGVFGLLAIANQRVSQVVQRLEKLERKINK